MKNICCKAFSCPYNFEGSYCLNPLPSFDNRGYCNFFWHSSPNMVQETKKGKNVILSNITKNIENELTILKKTDERVNEIYAKYGLFDWWIKNNCEGYHD